MSAVPQLDAACRFACEAGRLGLPPQVREAALQALVDWFAVSLAALDDPGPGLVRAQVRNWRTRGEALTLYGDAGAAAPVAWVNGTLAHSLDFDDMHFDTAVHATGPIMAAALAVGLDRGCPEEAILAAFVAGFEVTTTIGGGGVGPKLVGSGWHPTGVLGHFGAAVAAGSLMGLHPGQMAHALALAATQAGGLQVSGGSMAKPFHVGKAAMDGVLAAELAAAGMDAAPGVLDDAQRGILGVLFQKPAVPRMDELGRVWQIEGNTFKPYAACQLTHAPHEAARGLAEGFSAEGLRAVRVRVNPLALKVAGIPRPTTALEGKFSIAYCVALGLQGRTADMSAFEAATVADATLQQLTALVTIGTSEALERSAATVELEYADGQIRRSELAAVRGSPQRPLTWTDLEEKFTGCVRPVLGAAAGPLLEALRTFDQPGRLRQVRELLTRSTG